MQKTIKFVRFSLSFLMLGWGTGGARIKAKGISTTYNIDSVLAI